MNKEKERKEVEEKHECECQNKKNEKKEKKECKCDKEKANLLKQIEEANKNIEKLQSELEEAKHKTLSAQAELVNYRKRKDEEVSNMLKYANQDLILEIIQVMDNLERAIKVDKTTITEQMSKFLDGFEMIYAALKDALSRFGVKEIEAQGKILDGNYHMALLTDTDTTKQDDEILEVLLKGYILKDRVIRPASVKVNKLN